MNQFEHLKVLYTHIHNLDLEIKKYILENDMEALEQKVQEKELIVEKLNITKKNIKLTSEEKEILNKMRDEISQLELENIESLSQSKTRTALELSKINKKSQLQDAYETPEIQMNGSYIDVSE